MPMDDLTNRKIDPEGKLSEDTEVVTTTTAKSTAETKAILESAKPGWQTSEFWLMALIILAIVVLMLFDKITVSDVADLWPLIAGAVGYSISRGITKRKVI